MNHRHYFFQLLALLSACSFGVDSTPRKWAKHVSELPASPKVILDLSDSTFYCSGVILDKKNGAVLKTVADYPLQNNSRTFADGFVFAEDNRITVVDKNFELEWTKAVDTVSLLSVIQTPDGGFAALGGKGRTGKNIIRTDDNGAVVWNVNIHQTAHYDKNPSTGTADSAIIDIRGITALDDGLTVYGVTHPAFKKWYDTWILKFNSDGTEAWRRMFGGIETVEMIAAGNGIAFSGTLDVNEQLIGDKITAPVNLGKKCYFPTTNVPLIHLGADGELLLNKAFIGTDGDYGRSISYSDATYITAFYSYQLPIYNDKIESATVIAVDATGELLWRKEYDPGDLTTGIPVLRSQLFASGSLVIAAFDSIYYHDKIESAIQSNQPQKRAINPVVYTSFNAGGHFISYGLDNPSKVTATLFTLSGRRIATFDEGLKQPGSYRLFVTGLPAGSYLVRFLSNHTTTIQNFFSR